MLRNKRLAILLLSTVATTGLGQENPFSGPQPGERLPSFQIRLALGDRSGDTFDPVTTADDGPVMLVFVHEVTRPSIALTRTIVGYAHRFQKEGLQSTVVFLSSDPTETQAFVRRARHAMPDEVPLGISMDGLEGPGAYGLNRKVALTVLLGEEGRVMSNFALIQPSLAADAPGIGAAIQSLLGHDHKPKLAEMTGKARAGRLAMDDGSFRRILAPVIDRNASPEQVAEAAQKVERHAAKNPKFQQRLGEVTRRIIAAGRIDNYGTEPAREYLIKWSKE